jgi:hypothetical protein
VDGYAAPREPLHGLRLPVSGCPHDRVHAVPAMEATSTVRWCGLARRARHDGAVVGEHVAAVVEKKAGGRRAGTAAETGTKRSHGDA